MLRQIPHYAAEIEQVDSVIMLARRELRGHIFWTVTNGLEMLARISQLGEAEISKFEYVLKTR